MAQPLISVLVLTYHPDKDALFATLRSVVLQQDRNFEVIVADDGSGAFFEEEIRAFLEEAGYCYQILAHTENQGTVKNILDGVRLASGKYIKPISPGDLFYDENTLGDLAAFLEETGAKAAFGGMVFYACNPELQVKNLTCPVLPELYRTSRYDHKKVLKHQMVHNDFISGASAIYEKKAFARALETVSPAVRYAEDTVFQLFALEKTRIFAIDRNIVWYEYGSGISTQKHTGFTRVEEDFYRFYHLMTETFPRSAYARQACHTWELRKREAGKTLLLRKLRPDRLWFTLRARLRKRTLRAPQYNEEFFRKCTAAGK